MENPNLLASSETVSSPDFNCPSCRCVSSDTELWPRQCWLERDLINEGPVQTTLVSEAARTLKHGSNYSIF